MTIGLGSDDPIDELERHPRAAELLALSAGGLAPPAALRGRVLDAARAARPAGRPVGDVATMTPIGAFRRTLQDFAGLVDSLTDDEAGRPTIEGWTVAGLVGHLMVIEEHVGAVLGWWPSTIDPTLGGDHLRMTDPGARDAMSQPFDAVRARWHQWSDRVLDRLDDLADRLEERVDLHGFDFSIRSVLIARSFEVWTHHEDICRAVGRPMPELDIPRLRLMTDAAVRALPLGMLLSGQDARGRTVHVVLSGPGGGAWDQSLEYGGVPGVPSATLVTDAVEFCRVAARRRRGDDLEMSILGDAETAADVLVAAAVFAA